MIVIDGTIPASPTERSPLKGANSTHPSPIQAGPPPPPYYNMPGSMPYDQVVILPHNVPSAQFQVQSKSTGKRFLKALVVALLVLFLWGMLVESMDIVVNLRYPRTRHRITGSVFGDGSPNLPVRILRNHRSLPLALRIAHTKALTTKWLQERRAEDPCPPFNHSPVPEEPHHKIQIPVMPGRAVPIQYPPVVRRRTSQHAPSPTSAIVEGTSQLAPSPTSLELEVTPS